MDIAKKENNTRREFFKKIVGFTAIYMMPKLKVIAEEVLKTPENNEKLVAPCGLYCGACPRYIATQNKDEQKLNILLQQISSQYTKLTPADLQCDGCISNGRLAITANRCTIRECVKKKPTVTRCSNCPEFPCFRIINFNNDGMPHHAEVLGNCRSLNDVGIKKWAKSEEERWSCKQCKTKISWYDKKCSSCGTKRSEHLFSLWKFSWGNPYFPQFTFPFIGIAVIIILFSYLVYKYLIKKKAN